jgi:alcohol dehydrogenase class IV
LYHYDHLDVVQLKKQAVFCTIPTKFPVPKGIEDGVSLFIRSGCSSILTIGSGTVSDAGKAIRRVLVERNRGGSSSKVGAVDMSKQSESVHAQFNIPLVCVPRSISPTHHTGSFACLMNDEDAFLYRSASVPEVRQMLCQRLQNDI